MHGVTSFSKVSEDVDSLMATVWLVLQSLHFITTPQAPSPTMVIGSYLLGMRFRGMSINSLLEDEAPCPIINESWK